MKKIIALLLSIMMLIAAAVTPVCVQAASVGKVSSLKATAYSQSVKLSWKRVSGATGYQVYYSVYKSKNYKKAKTISNGLTTSATVNKLKSSKTYYFKVRATKGSKKGSFSKVVSAKTQKSFKSKLLSSSWRLDFYDVGWPYSMKFKFYKNGKVYTSIKDKNESSFHSYDYSDCFTYEYIGNGEYAIVDDEGIYFGVIRNSSKSDQLKIYVENDALRTMYSV